MRSFFLVPASTAPELTRWVQAAQVLSVLSIVGSLPDGELFAHISIMGVIGPVLSLLILKFSLHFARASAPFPSNRAALHPA